MQQSASAAERLIVALDLDSPSQALALVDRLGESANFYKIGYQLAYAGGLELVGELKARGKRVFLDLKLLDIDQTVAKGVESVLRLGADMLTIHAYPKAMRAAVGAARGSPLVLIGVTVLTSMDDADLAEAGYSATAVDLVGLRAGQVLDAGMGGIVCSAQEAAAVRAIVGEKLAIVTPGIRPIDAASHDQKRIMTPAQAIAAGASHLVVGRPISAATDPALAARGIVNEIESTPGRR